MANNQNMEPADTGRDGTQVEERMFTQEELEEILQKRLARDRRSRSGTDEIQAREKALEEREKALAARERLTAAGIPAALADYLRYDDDDSLGSAIEMIQAQIQAQGQTGMAAGWGERPSAGRSQPADDPIRRAMGLDNR